MAALQPTLSVSRNPWTHNMTCQRSPACVERPLVTCAASNSGSSSSDNHSYSFHSSRTAQRQKTRRAKAPGLFEVRVITPPPKSLGIYALPPLTHNGEEIEVDGQGYVVTSVSIQMKLLKGRYVRDHSTLNVTPTSRYFLNLSLDNLLKAKYVGPTGLQD